MVTPVLSLKHIVSASILFMPKIFQPLIRFGVCKGQLSISFVPTLLNSPPDACVPLELLCVYDSQLTGVLTKHSDPLDQRNPYCT